MNSNQFNEAWTGIETGWKNGQLAHAYLLRGAPHGTALHFAEQMLDLIFDYHPQVRAHTHPDIVWIEPQSKSRQIVIDEIRELIRRLSQTSFAGGWKAGVIICADRMNDQAANALLKTLEEPPQKSLLLLITDEPQSLLPTISSRCQRISLAEADEEVSRVTRLPSQAAGKHWKSPLLNILCDLPPATITETGLFTGRITGLLNELKKEFEKEETERLPEDLSAKESKALLDARSTARLIEARTEILRTVLQWQRDILMLVLGQESLHFPDDRKHLERQAILCSRADAMRRIAAVEEMSRQFDRNLPAELVFNSFFAQLVG